MTEILRKLAAARTRLILDKPFLGALVLRLPLQESNAGWCTTTATDARLPMKRCTAGCHTLPDERIG